MADGDKITVFIVDDNIMARKMLMKMLSDDGNIEVVGEAGTGQGGLIMIDESLPDILFLESSVSGGMELQEVLNHVKQLSPDTKVILCVESSNQDDVIKGDKIGIADFICKPYRANEIIRIVKEVYNGE